MNNSITPKTGNLTVTEGEASAIHTQLGYVAFLDALGFRSLVTSDKGNQKVFEYLETIRNSVRLSNAADIEAIVFSDSIVLMKGGSEPEDLRLLCMTCSRVMFDLLAHRIPVRGAIAYGEYTTSDIGPSVFLAGQPVIEAYDREKIQDWVGIMLCASTLNQIRELDLPIKCAKNFAPHEAFKVSLEKYLEWRGYLQFNTQIAFHGPAVHEGFAILPGGGSSLEQIRKNVTTAIEQLEWLKLIAPTPLEQAKYSNTLAWLVEQRTFWEGTENYYADFLRRQKPIAPP